MNQQIELKGKVWLISDTHLYHRNIQKYCGRPEGFEELIYENWNKLVSEEDTIIHLGDVIFGNTEKLTEVLSKLKGHKHLVIGNHDKRGKVGYLKAGFETIQRELVINQILLTHKPASLRSGINTNIFAHIHNNNLTSKDYSSEVKITDKHRVFTLEHHYSPILLTEFMKDDSNLALKRIK